MNLSKLRNIGLAAHIDAGKTTTTERILFYSGKIRKMGEVDEGSATMDWMVQERERGITITSAATTCFWKQHRINIIDTPGHVDFTIEVERAMKVLDGVIVVFCGYGGVEPQSETIWRQADNYRIPRIGFINKLDRTGSDYERVFEDMEKRLTHTPVPITVPIGRESNFIGVIDLVEEKGYRWGVDQEGINYEPVSMTEEIKMEIRRWKEILIDKLSRFDDEILNLYLDGEEITVNSLKSKIRELTIKGDIYPIFAGSSLKKIGVQKLIDGVIDYLPSPLDIPPMRGINPETGKEEERNVDENEPLSALVFKIIHDLHMGVLGFLRVYSGKLKKGQTVKVIPVDKKNRVLRLFIPHANVREEVKEVGPGEIVLVGGLRDIKTGYTITDMKHPIAYETIESPEPVIFVAIEPKTKADEEKLIKSLDILSMEDPSFRVKVDSETGQRIISGMGELHIEIIVDRLKREHKVLCNVSKPYVSYRETILEEVEELGTFQKIIGGKVHFAIVGILLKPLERGIKIVWKDVLIPQSLKNSLEERIKQNLESGVFAGYSITNIYVEITRVEYDKENISEIAFHSAVSIAFRNAFLKGNPILLQPIMKLEVIFPDEFMGDVIGDINTRGGSVNSIERIKENTVIKATVPLSKTFGYSTALRSLTQGRGTYTMQFSHYDPLSKEAIESIIG